MSGAFVMWLDNLSGTWAQSMWRGCWQGAILLALVWAACRLLPRIPSTARYWLWWIACAKFVLAAVVSPVIPLAVLPATTSAVSTQSGAVNLPIAVPPHAITLPFLSHSRPIAARATADQASTPSTAGVAPGRPVSSISACSVLFLGWMLVVALLAISTARGSLRLTGIVRRGRPAGDDIKSTLGDLGAVRVRAIVSDEVDGLCVTGVLRPVLLVPSTWASTMSDSEKRMAVAHEVAHLRRFDLLFDLVPALASTLFFFLPLVRLAARALRQAREEACDAAAVQAVACSFEDYAGMLLKAAGGQATAGALCLSPAYQQLRGRLVGLAASAQSASRAVKIVAASLIAVGLAVSAPWRLVARAAVDAAKGVVDRTRYTIVDLGPISGVDASHFQINDQDQVVGTSGSQPVLWQGHGAQGLSTLWYHNGRGGAINNAGVYTVTCYSDAGNPHAFYSANGPHLVKGIRGYRFTVARGVNDAGLVVGSAQRAGADGAGAEISRAVLVSGGKTHDLGTLGGDYSAAYAVNASGEVVGKADLAPLLDGSRATHAFLWAGGQMRDLGTLGGSSSLAYSVNRDGLAAGFSRVAGDDTRHACVWSTTNNNLGIDGQAIDLGTLPGDTASEAHSVNDRNQVVGTSDAAPGAASNRAVLWDNGAAVDLNGSVDTHRRWFLEDAMGINNRGVIVGKGRLNGVEHAFVLMPKK